MTTKEMLPEISGDAVLAEKIRSLKTPGEVYAVLKAHGLTDSAEEFARSFDAVMENVSRLRPDELDAIVGGGEDTTIVTIPRRNAGMPEINM